MDKEERGKQGVQWTLDSTEKISKENLPRRETLHWQLFCTFRLEWVRRLHKWLTQKDVIDRIPNMFCS